jgi:hypothetical protein
MDDDDPPAAGVARRELFRIHSAFRVHKRLQMSASVHRRLVARSAKIGALQGNPPHRRAQSLRADSNR